MPVSSVTEYCIRPDALKINLNHFGDPDYLQVSLLAGATIIAFKQNIIEYNAAFKYRSWPIVAANTYLDSPEENHIYARLTRTEINPQALIIYDTKLRDIEGRELTYIKNEETGVTEENYGEANDLYFFIYLGTLSAAIDENGHPIDRYWSEPYRSGMLDTNQERNEILAAFDKMFSPHYENPSDPTELTWIEAKAHLGIRGGLTSFIQDAFKIPGLYDGLPVDNQTIYWEEVDGVKVLKAKGSGNGEGTIKDVTVNGEGNALTSVSLSGDKKSLVFGKDKTFAEKTYLDENFYTKKNVDDNFYNKTYLDSNFAKKTYVDHNFVTLATSQTITGGKNFTGGLSVNGCELVYNSYYGYWKLTGDLLVTGGISTFSSDMSFSPSTIMDGIVCDGQTIKVENINGVKTLKVIGGTGGGVDEQAVKQIIEKYNYLTLDKLPIATTSQKGIASFDSSSFSVSSGHVSFTGAKIKMVTSTPSSYESNTLYVMI